MLYTPLLPGAAGGTLEPRRVVVPLREQLERTRLAHRHRAAAYELAGEPSRRRPFRYRTLGVFVDTGRHQAVASTLGIKWRGFPAWFLARTYHLALMPGNGRRARLVTDRTTGLLFGRDSAELGQLGHPAGAARAQRRGHYESEPRREEVVSRAGVGLDD